MGSFVWASLRQTAVSLNISRVDIAGRCPGLALWSRSQCFFQVLLLPPSPPSPSPEVVGAFTPNWSPSGVFSHFSGGSDPSKTKVTRKQPRYLGSSGQRAPFRSGNAWIMDAKGFFFGGVGWGGDVCFKGGFLSRLCCFELGCSFGFPVAFGVTFAGGQCLPWCSPSPQGEESQLWSSVVCEAERVDYFNMRKYVSMRFSELGRPCDPGLKWKDRAASAEVRGPLSGYVPASCPE